ncbi:hypothetical protein [Oceanicoccus sp. KOV_DT_Chl]|uniref:hypothetical protein n=1 Tax=Oceanicoccus sp. KOV_DT_Chl TaxID=1904639 RepID=UPI000C7B777C|nr:hypothetical protein [Oceanicoccus sp. KOV_DT_Chl]
MAKVDVSESRSIVSNTHNGLRIEIPAKKNWFLILFLGFWLVGWLFGEISVLTILLMPKEGEAPTLFLIAWLGGWTVGGAFAIYAWAWNVFGKEVVEVNFHELALKKVVGNIKRSKEFDLAHVKDIRVQPSQHSMWSSRGGMEFWGISGGTIAFDYGHSTHKFAVNLDEAEAKYLIEKIEARL